MTWWIYALISAGFASATAVLAKIGVRDVPSNLATGVRTTVILIFVWVLIFARGEHQSLGALNRRSIFFLCLSGIATGASWLAYFKALQLGPASRVQPIDKVSLALTIVLAWLVLGEPMTWRLALGVVLMVAGALLAL